MRLWPALIVATLMIVSTALSAEKFSDTASASIPCFVDLDGDGLDDNIRDLNSDGIPDFDNYNGSVPAISCGGSGIFTSMNTGTTDITETSEKFGERKFATRWLGSNRGGFSSNGGFGPGAGISSAAIGKVCIGGVCF